MVCSPRPIGSPVVPTCPTTPSIHLSFQCFPQTRFRCATSSVPSTCTQLFFSLSPEFTLLVCVRRNDFDAYNISPLVLIRVDAGGEACLVDASELVAASRVHMLPKHVGARYMPPTGPGFLRPPRGPKRHLRPTPYVPQCEVGRLIASRQLPRAAASCRPRNPFLDLLGWGLLGNMAMATRPPFDPNGVNGEP